MRNMGCLVAGCTAWLVLALPAPAADTSPDGLSKEELAKRIQKMVLSKLPKKYEDLSQWGTTIMPPPMVRFPRLRRVAVQVGDHLELPHGNWKRTLIWVPEPEKNVRIAVEAIKKIDKDTTRVTIDASALVAGERELQKWVNGARLLDVTVAGDVVFGFNLDVDVTVKFDLTKPLEGIKASVKIPRLELDLKDLNIRRLGPVVVLEQGPLVEELKGALRARLKALEPLVKDYANKLIEKEAEKGKGLITDLMGK